MTNEIQSHGTVWNHLKNEFREVYKKIKKIYNFTVYESKYNLVKENEVSLVR